MLRRAFAVLALSLASLSLAPASAKPVEFFQVEGVTYDESVPAFEDQAGYEIGERPVRYADMVAYLRGLAERSDRISVETIGYSHERRPILTFTVTSPTNHANIETIRQTHLARLEGNAAPSAAPMVLWINWGVHGSETSSMDGAIPLLYHYAAAQGPAVEAQLSDAVMIVTVTFNPDGHARRINHVETFWSYGENTDLNDAAHNLWTEARVNHYWFDLNRQWLLLTQPESQAWIRQWHKWKPMVSADYHEMGSSSPYYFHPGEELRRNPLIPRRARELTQAIGQRHAAFMDSEARLYSTEEGFDNFYIGKGSTYPQINGSLGILFEAGAARGGSVETERGLVETADNARTHFRTALTTIQGSLDLRDQITAYQRDFFAENARQAAGRGGWVFTAKGDPERAARFVRLLNMHDIAVRRLSGDVSADGRIYPAGTSYFVPTAQTNSRMIRGIFERLTRFEENVFYDVSGWTLPLAYDLEYSQVGSAPAGDLADGGFQSAPAPDRASYGYVFDWSHTYAPRALNRILSKDVMARAAMEETVVRTTAGDVPLGRGSIFVPLARQETPREEIHAIMEEIAAKDGVPVYAATTGLTPVTGKDLGAVAINRALENPRVVLAYEGGLARYDVGEVWWTLDFRHRVPVTIVKKDDLGSLDWSEYTHLVLVGGEAAFDEDLTEAVKGWIENGGTLIATRDAALWAEEAILGRADEEDESEEAPEEASEEDGETGTVPERLDFADMSVRDAEHVIGGAIFAADLDTSHPLGFGFADRDLPVHRNESFTLTRPEDNPYAVPVQYTQEPLLTGYASQRRQEEIAGTPSVVAERVKSGAVILMADNPVFRGTYPGTEKLLMNAIFFSSLIDAPRGDYDPENETD
ncbi:MAG: M14 family zinc carboxypeptidase [Erythrobacter sp.]|uniref:M14 family zinc carboxypeptidase n=1 Tax=Erythrobacter sp. TaxID=1042 RepID=UPI00260EB6DE|nr:M14 family zinc carboxypeptidase [Erythrobacter sp.]MDJ0978614.1 M14 family zinc carboxypeptidase [Erythrobacter sp.]